MQSGRISIGRCVRYRWTRGRFDSVPGQGAAVFVWGARPGPAAACWDHWRRRRPLARNNARHIEPGSQHVGASPTLLAGLRHTALQRYLWPGSVADWHVPIPEETSAGSANRKRTPGDMNIRFVTQAA